MIKKIQFQRLDSILPPAYRRLFLRLEAIGINRKLDIIQFDTVFFFAEGSYFSKKKTVKILSEFEKLELIEIIPLVGIKILDEGE